MKHFEIWDDIILFELIWRLSIEWEDWDYTLSIFDKSNNLIIDIWYEDKILWESYRDDFLEYLSNKQ